MSSPLVLVLLLLMVVVLMMVPSSVIVVMKTSFFLFLSGLFPRLQRTSSSVSVSMSVVVVSLIAVVDGGQMILFESCPVFVILLWASVQPVILLVAESRWWGRRDAPAGGGARTHLTKDKTRDFSVILFLSGFKYGIDWKSCIKS